MIGSTVIHPLYGRGQVREVRNAAREAVVRFDNGIRSVVPTSILTFLNPAGTPAKIEIRSTLPQREETVPTDEQLRRIEARRTIEALRYGVVPSKRLRDMTVGLTEQRQSLSNAFESVQTTGGDVRVVVGEYGSGKSHFFEYAAQEALDRNYLVATTSLDIQEVPPNRPQRIYNSLIRTLRYPDTTDSGSLVPLLERLVTRQTLLASLSEQLKDTIFRTVLHNYSVMRNKPGDELDLLLDWISGEKIYIRDIRMALATRNQKEFPVRALSTMTNAADQYCYLLNGWSWLAAQAGYQGLAVLIDESEHYSLLTQRGQEKADNFFKGIIYTTLASRSECRITEADLQHQQHEHPFRLTDGGRLLVMFAATPAANTFDYQRWLHPHQIVTLDQSIHAQTLEELMARLYVLHRQAYRYDQSEKYLEIAKGLLDCFESRLVNLRQLIRLATEIYDVCYAHPDFPATQAVNEVRSFFLGRR